MLHVNRFRQRACARLLSWSLVAGASALTGCTKVDLFPIERDPPSRDDRLTVGGGLCTRPPSSRVAPLRVLFVVDASESMEVTDPPSPVTGEAGRQRAVRETWETLLDNDPEGVRIGIVRFSSEAQASTPIDLDMDGLADTYYTADRTVLAAATDRLGLTNRATNYDTALAEAYLEMRTELVAADEASLPLSRYVVIFLSDGLPDGDVDDPEQAPLDGVKNLVDLARIFRVGKFEFHTAYLSSGQGPDLDREAQELLQLMADRGNGTFRSFPSGESINFLFAGLTTIRSVFTVNGLSVMNLNAVVDIAQLEAFPPPVVDAGFADGNLTDGEVADGNVDADIDAGDMDAGVPEDTGVDAGADADVGIAPREPGPDNFADRDGDEWPSCGEPLSDTDGDGLSDLMEGVLGTNPLLPDTDDDGLRDVIEWRIEDLDPLDPSDSGCDYAGPMQRDQPCVDMDNDMFCDCLRDADLNGICDCAELPDLTCRDTSGHDCVDLDMDGICDCPDDDMDGFCDYDDRDGDLLNDCEEQYYGARQNGFDSEPDTIPDLVEVLRRGDPADRDSLFDGDWDSTNNEIELLNGTDLWCDESAIRSRVSYLAELETLETIDGQTCYDFEIRNIPLMPTLPNDDAAWPGNGWNRILVYASEVSFDDPNTFGAFRLACAMVRYEPDGNYKNPPSGRVRLSDEDFVDARIFDPDLHCVWP